MILDEYLADRDFLLLPRRTRERLTAAARRARRFVFSPAASRLAGTLATEAGDLVISHRQFALPPFPTTFVEFDSDEFFAAARKNHPEDQFHWAEYNQDDRFGYLIDGTHLFGFGWGDRKGEDDRKKSGMAVWYYDVRQPGQEAEPDTFRVEDQNLYQAWRGGPTVAGPNEHNWHWWKAALILGRSGSTFEAQRAMPDIMRACSVQAIFETGRLRQEGLTKALTGSMGDVRNFWAAMLWLNQPSRISHVDVPGERRIRRGKMATFHPYRTVEIDLGAKYRSIRRAFLTGAPRVPPGEHDVRGEFHHRGGLRVGCSHVWPLIPEPSPSGKDRGIVGIWTCERCGRRRWFVESHRRGDPSRPIVHDYKVVKEEREGTR